MRFDAFSKIIFSINSYDLPGKEAQLQMAPPFRDVLLKQTSHLIDNAKLAAVIALFYPGKNHNTYLAFILRKPSPDVHSGQIGFPGGKPEAEDLDLQHTALRETMEEIGVQPEAIQIITSLSEVYIPPSNYNVFPFIGITNETPDFKLQISEVESVIEVSLKSLMNPKHQIITPVKTSYGLSVSVPAFNFNGHIVWGATAMILTEIIYLLNLILKK
jgi:8-oxo-dGTP pyrophosphatase MutT (NUDIX family)